MLYFRTQQQAVDLFKQLNKASKTGRVIFIIEHNKALIKPLINDLAILLQDKDVRVKGNSIRVPGTKEHLSKIIYVYPEAKYILAGVEESQIIRMGRVNDNGRLNSNN